MRLKPEIKQFVKETSSWLFPGAEIYLFGSRLNDEAAGGDIDILILSDEKIENALLRRFRVNFHKEFGWQKIDLVNLLKEDNSTFKRLILPEAKLL